MALPITVVGASIQIRVPYPEMYRAESVPNAKWNRKNKIWVAPLLKASCRHILETFSEREMLHKDIELMKGIVEYVPPMSVFPPHEFRNPPMKHQMRALNKAWGKKVFAFFMRMRTGKTFTTLMWSERLFLDGKIDSICVVCPTPVKEVWVEECKAHLSLDVDVETFVMTAGRYTEARRFMRKQPEEGKRTLKVMVFGLESFSQGKAHEVAREFVETHDTMMVIDESHGIKNFKSARTDKLCKIGSASSYSCILTGTPIAQGIEDLYSQYGFLSPSVIGMSSYYSFRNRYCIMGGYDAGYGPTKIVGYNNVKELMNLLAPYTIVVETKEAFPNLPDRIDKRLVVEPTKEQVQAMRSLKDELIAVDGDETLEIETALERMVRYQQIAGGHFPFGKDDGYDIKPISGKNPKMDALIELIEMDSNAQKYIIWANFVPEIELIEERLKERFGPQSVVTFYGKTSPEERTEARQRFQTDPACRFFVSNQATGGMGIKLSVADIMVYYSNSFKYVDREQSGERWIDHARVHNILVVDLVLNHKVDKDIHRALTRKEDVAKYVAESLK